jgi:hypothetical protein
MNKTSGILTGALLLLSFFAVIGCGGGDGGASDWAKPQQVIAVSSLRGQVLPPVAGASLLSAKPAFALLSVEGTEVYLEEKPELRATVASTGVFLFSGVPVGKYHVIAQRLVGTTSYRQRSDLVDLTGKYDIQEMAAPIPLSVAPYKVKFAVYDLLTGSPIAGARLRVWGADYMVAADGSAEVGPLSHGFWPVRIIAAGYRESVIHVGFQEQRRASLQVKLTPLTATDQNRAPLVEMNRGFVSFVLTRALIFMPPVLIPTATLCLMPGAPVVADFCKILVPMWCLMHRRLLEALI